MLEARVCFQQDKELCCSIVVAVVVNRTDSVSMGLAYQGLATALPVDLACVIEAVE